MHGDKHLFRCFEYIFLMSWPEHLFKTYVVHLRRNEGVSSWTQQTSCKPYFVSWGVHVWGLVERYEDTWLHLDPIPTLVGFPTHRSQVFFRAAVGVQQVAFSENTFLDDSVDYLLSYLVLLTEMLPPLVADKWGEKTHSLHPQTLETLKVEICWSNHSLQTTLSESF